MTPPTLNESPREAALREAARELVASIEQFAASVETTLEGDLGDHFPATLPELRAAIAKMEEVL